MFILNKLKGILYRFKDKEKKNLKKQLKKENSKIIKTTLDILPIVDYEDDFIKMKDGYMNIYQIATKDIYSLNSDEAFFNICSFTKVLRMYEEDMKIVSMVFPVNTSEQQQYLERVIQRTTNKIYLKFLHKKLKQIKFVEEYRTNKEFYVFIYGKDKDSMKFNENNLIKCSSNGFLVSSLSLDKKKKILYKMCNQSYKI